MNYVYVYICMYVAIIRKVNIHLRLLQIYISIYLYVFCQIIAGKSDVQYVYKMLPIGDVCIMSM